MQDDEESDELLCLLESTGKQIEESSKRERAEIERIGSEKAAEISNLLAKLKKERREEDAQEAERKRLKCLGWWQRQDFKITIKRLLGGLNDQPWLDTQCFLQQDYQISMEPAIQHIKNYIQPKLHGFEFIVGITVDVWHRWNRKDKNAKTGDWIGYKLQGFEKMYIVHVSPRHKADLSIGLFEKDPEQQQQLIYRDISNGRMEMNLCKRDGTGSHTWKTV